MRGMILFKAQEIVKINKNQQLSLMFVHCPNVNKVCQQAFEGFYSLKRFSSNKLRQIQARAFFGCSTLEHILVNKVTALGEEAFAYC